MDATEIWHFHAGAPVLLSVAAHDRGPRIDHILGPDPGEDQNPQIIVPARHWQSARSTGAYSLLSCTVSPGFEFADFTVAQPGFDIP